MNPFCSIRNYKYLSELLPRPNFEPTGYEASADDAVTEMLTSFDTWVGIMNLGTSSYIPFSLGLGLKQRTWEPVHTYHLLWELR